MKYVSLLCLWVLSSGLSAAPMEKISRDNYAEFLGSKEIIISLTTLADPGKSAPAALNAEKEGFNWQVLFYYCEVPETAEGCLDMQFRAEHQGQWSEAFTDNWNSQRRFGRVYKTESGMGMISDVNIEGGVNQDFLRVMTDVWLEYMRLVWEARLDQNNSTE